MKKLALLALVAWAAFQGYERLRDVGGPEPLHDEPYVVVYGRDACGLTSAMRREVARAGVPLDYQQIDLPAVADPLHERMRRAGLSTRSYPLPVVDVSGTLRVSPQAGVVAAAYRDSLRDSAPVSP